VQLAQVYASHGLSVGWMGKWLEQLREIPTLQAEPLAYLFKKVSIKEGMPAHVVENFIETTLILCTNKAINISQLSTAMEYQLDRAESHPLFTSIEARTHPTFTQLLNAASQNQDSRFLTVRIDLLKLQLSDRKITLKTEHAVGLSELADACEQLLEESAIPMTEFVINLLSATEARPNQVTLFRLISDLALNLLRSYANPEAVNKLDVELLKETWKLETDQGLLQADSECLRNQLLKLLSTEYSLSDLEKLLMRCTHIVQVTKTYIRWFDTVHKVWENSIHYVGIYRWTFLAVGPY